MALTAEQKEANKAKRKIRDAAYSARKREYKAAMEVALSSEALEAVEKAKNDAIKNSNDLIQARNDKIQDIRNKIYDLQDLIRQVEAEYEPILNEARELRTNLCSAYFNAESEVKAKVDGQYPDMANCFYVVSWNPPEGYIEAFAEKMAEAQNKPERKKQLRMQ